MQEYATSQPILTTVRPEKTKGSLFEKTALCAPSGARTLDPNIKSVVLYQLS